MPRHTTQPALIPGGLSAPKGCTEGQPSRIKQAPGCVRTTIRTKIQGHRASFELPNTERSKDHSTGRSGTSGV